MKAKLIKRIAGCMLACGLIVSCFIATSYAMQEYENQAYDGNNIVPLVANELNFYPSFDENHKLPDGIRFYKDAEGTQDITLSATSMSNLADALGTTDGKLNKLYASIPQDVNLKCYTTQTIQFDEVFGTNIDGVATKYSDDFINKYCINGINGIHFDNSSDNDSWKRTEESYQADANTPALVNGINYKDFYLAYSEGLSKGSAYVWSTTRSSICKEYAYNFHVDKLDKTGEWITQRSDVQSHTFNAVALTKNFHSYTTYTVTYNSNKPHTATSEMSGTTQDSKHIYNIESALTPNGFSLRGYTFVGWNTTPDRTGTEYKDSEKVKNLTAEDEAVITLFAQWEPTKYNVTLDPNGGSGEKIIVEATYDVYLPHLEQFNAPRIYGVHFDGYFDAKEGGKQYYDDRGRHICIWDKDAECTLYAHYVKGSIQSLSQTIDGKVLNFYPSFDDNHKIPEGVYFYKDLEGTQDITASATSMSELAKALGSTNGKSNTLYADIPSGVQLECYTTVDRPWDTTFYRPPNVDVTDSGNSYKFWNRFEEKYCVNGIQGIYFEPTIDYYTWRNKDKKPTVNGVSYTQFYKAYKPFLSSKSCHPWSTYYCSSLFLAVGEALAFDAPNDKWDPSTGPGYSLMLDKESVVLHKSFWS